MMRTGRILAGRAVEEAVLAMAMTMKTARVMRTRKAVRKELGKGRVITMGRRQARRRQQRKGR